MRSTSTCSLRSTTRALEIEGNHAARAAVIIGEGKAFSTGGDIKAWAALLPHEFGFDWVRVGHRVFNRLAELRVPLIAALSGHALGGGLELAAAADIRNAEPQSRLGMPRRVWAWCRMVGYAAGPPFRRAGRTAHGARRRGLSAAKRLHGLVDEVVETGHALEAAMAYASKVAERGPAAIQTAKLSDRRRGGTRPRWRSRPSPPFWRPRPPICGKASMPSAKRPPAFTGEW
jgi:enoyl-CoA hydratase/carnithine racemase